MNAVLGSARTVEARAGMESGQDGTAEIGRRLRDLRRERGLKQSDLAGEGMSVSYLSLLESGKRPVTPVILRRLAARLDCTVEYLRTGLASDQELERQQQLLLRTTRAELALRGGELGAALASCDAVLAEEPPAEPATRRRAETARAAALERLNRPAEALAVLHELYRDELPGPGSAEWLRLAVALCRCHLAAGEPARAAELGQGALARLNAVLATPTEDHLGLGVVLIEAEHRSGALAAARELADRLLPHAEHTASPATRADAFRQGSRRAEQRGETALALTLAERALALPAEDELARHLGLLKAGYGSLLLDGPVPEPALAKQYLAPAGAELARCGRPLDRAGCELGLARAELMLGQYEDGAAHAERALELVGREYSGLGVWAWLQLGEARRLQGREQEAAEALHTVERLLGEAELRLAAGRERAEAWRALGDQWLDHGCPEPAMNAYRQGLAAAGLSGAAPLRAVLRPAGL
ncbi:transcriptional regulator with XRE-family HTH domain [Kitasatospora sp. GAS204A]|uniref:helix-turn-helix domain-containing protein n=1 Tax=unclassified Kitasatospora TaxID=2633591 RepID=UPI0024738DD3|nr:helix-turn-helix transcriptional regulator [Kitasatospora sp. GAS204B]MDH6115796.1 transcriptional regulator with XRE-family HTH domain [Kitasatospora sp. GAS204B]